MKLNQHFVVYDMDGETMLVPTAGAAFHGLGQGNETVGVILHCLTKETTEAEIVEALAAAFDGSRADMAADVHAVIEKLRAIGAMEE